MEFITLASSSAGNASLVREGDTALLIDAGISARRITRELALIGVDPHDLAAVLITHEHSDHIRGLETLCRQCTLPAYASRGTAEKLPCAQTLRRPFDAGDAFTLGSLRVKSFRTSHDAADSVGYRIEGADAALGILTDTGRVTEEARAALAGVSLLLLEANHDVERLRLGPYPYPLKRRILSDRGHLSNEAAAEFALDCVRSGTNDILLAHLSAENNTPELAYYAVARKLQQCGRMVRLGVAPRDCASGLHEVTPCKTSICSASGS